MILPSSATVRSGLMRATLPCGHATTPSSSTPRSAAQNKAMLDGMGITHVVNCTDNMPQYHEKDRGPNKITYLRFPTSFWKQYEADLTKFIRPLFNFVDEALAKGGNVLVHCLAGAHRAGTTGCMLLMYKAMLAQVAAAAAVP